MAEYGKEQLPRSSTSRPSPCRAPERDDSASVEVDDRTRVRSPVPHVERCLGNEESRGRLFILTSRSRGKAERSGRAEGGREAQCEKVSLDRWTRVDKDLGILLSEGECDTTVMSSALSISADLFEGRLKQMSHTEGVERCPLAYDSIIQSCPVVVHSHNRLEIAQVAQARR